jgi:opacity protein-like surface antigen
MKNLARTVAPLLLLVATATAPSTARAQLAQGAVEISPTVSFNHWNVKREGYGNVDAFTRFDFTPTIGFCLTAHHEVNVGLTMQYEKDGDEGHTRLGALTGYQYNFDPRGGFIPYAGIGLGANFGEGFTFDGSTLVAPVLTGGMRILVGGAGSVNLSLSYLHETDNHVSVNRMLAGVGVSLFPWRLH